jgi:hypothetical protein
VTLSGLAGGHYLPLPASKGLAFPFLLTLHGYTPPLQQFTLKDNGFLQRLRKLQLCVLLTFRIFVIKLRKFEILKRMVLGVG